MVRDKLYIIDTLFSHAHSSSWYNKPEEFEWVRSPNDDHIFLTDNSLNLVDSIDANNKYAWLIESPRITPHAYEFIKNNHNKFNKIFTFSKDLLELSENTVLAPIGGCWIKKEDRLIHNKSKDVSIILSQKKTTEGHRLRHAIINKYSEIDSFGFNNYIENKIIGLKNYRFSIIIENCKEDYYFTEKLIDCFMTGTVPIYWGCPSIGDFFNEDGMIIFDNIENIESILEYISEDKYQQMVSSVKANYELAKNYLVCDDLIFNFLKK
tara:strand:+ start:3147 stop:3944 length:798 start_codon:yes stop_codon:yes gene_type:complete